MNNTTTKAKWSQSQHRFTYFVIAVKHFTSPRHVYNLAHGAYVYRKDRGIIHDLVKSNILTRTK